VLFGGPFLTYCFVTTPFLSPQTNLEDQPSDSPFLPVREFVFNLHSFPTSGIYLLPGHPSLTVCQLVSGSSRIICRPWLRASPYPTFSYHVSNPPVLGFEKKSCFLRVNISFPPQVVACTLFTSYLMIVPMDTDFFSFKRSNPVPFLSFFGRGGPTLPLTRFLLLRVCFFFFFFFFWLFPFVLGPLCFFLLLSSQKLLEKDHLHQYPAPRTEGHRDP